MNLDASTKETLRQYTSSMQKHVTLILNAGEHPQRDELKNLLEQLSSVSEFISFEERHLPELRSGLSFTLESDKGLSGIQFSGIPGGHEFNSLVLAILQVGGTPLKLDDRIQDSVRKINSAVKFEIFISLSCHFCPEVVQALNQFALLNENISSEMIDGGQFSDLVEAREIQAVPTVYLNGELFSNGKADVASLLEKLQEKFPHIKLSQPKRQLPVQDVTVIGAGPAGVSAAIYAARKGLQVTIVADRFGGQVKDTMGIENLISVSETTGPKLTAALQAHMEDYEINLVEHVKVESVRDGSLKSIGLNSGETIESKTVIVASGARWRELGVPGEKEYLGKGVAYCPHCDGPLFKGKNVAVIGGGNSGIEAAIDLAGIARSVTVLEFAPELKADEILVNKAKQMRNITMLSNVETKEILASQGKVSGLAYRERRDNQNRELAIDGVFVQIGLVPNSQFLQGTLELSPYGEVVIDAHGRTSIPGIFACGDVSTVPFKQIVVAMGEGAKASLSAFDFLIKNDFEKAGDKEIAA